MKIEYQTPVMGSSHMKINQIDLRKVYIILDDDIQISLDEIIYSFLKDNKIIKEK